MRKKSQLISAILFLALIIVLPVISFFSEIRSKGLSAMPEFSFKSVMDKSYMSELDGYASEHFIGSTQWTKAKVVAETTIGKNELNGVYITNGRFMQKPEEPDYDKVNKAVLAINTFADENKPNVYVMFVPTAGGIYRDEMPQYSNLQNQKDFIEYLYGGLSNKITPIDVYNTLYAVRDEYIYYRNDYNWTSYGAYNAYKTAIKKLGFSSVDYNKFNIEHASNDFKGTLYSKTLYDGIEADTVDIYSYEKGSVIKKLVIDDGTEEKTYDSMYFRDYLDEKDKYSLYLGGNNPFVHIETDVKNDKKLLVIKDSYANCFVPFLAQHYNTIDVLDMSCIKSSYKDLVDMEEYNQVLILYSASDMADDETLKMLAD